MKKFLKNLAGLLILLTIVFTLSFSLITFPAFAQNPSQCRSVCVRFQAVVDQLQNATEKEKVILTKELERINTQMKQLHCSCVLQ